MRHLSFILLTLVVFVFYTGCQSPDPQTEPDMEADMEAVESDEDGQAYDGVGVIKDITPTRIVIDHEQIEGYMMAMTMPFNIRDEALLEGISVEDSVSFTVTVDSLSLSYISALTKME